MIDKRDVIAYFDEQAPSWDSRIVTDDEIIGTILENAGVRENSRVLDVACGTGVLIPYYLDRKAACVTAIDISPEMVRLAREKAEKLTGKTFSEVSRGRWESADNGSRTGISIICADVEEARLEDTFDCIMIYNAFPHFPDPERLIRRLSGLLAREGTLSVAHSMSRRAVDLRHRAAALHISRGVMDPGELAVIFEKYLEVTTVISDERMYQTVGVRKGRKI